MPKAPWLSLHAQAVDSHTRLQLELSTEVDLDALISADS